MLGIDSIHRRYLEFQLRRGNARGLIRAVVRTRPSLKPEAAALLIQMGAGATREALYRECLELCRRRQAVWDRGKPPSIDEEVYERYIAEKKKRGGVFEHSLYWLSAVALRMGDEAVDALLDTYTSHEMDKKAGTWLGFACLGSAGSTDLRLMRKMCDLYGRRSLEVMRGISHAERADGEVIDTVCRGATDLEFSIIQKYPVEALGRLGDRRALSVLSKLARQHYFSTSGVAEAVADALASLGGHEALAPLTALLNRKVAPDATIRAAALAIADVGDQSGLQPLRERLEELKGLYRCEFPECLLPEHHVLLSRGKYREDFDDTARVIAWVTLALVLLC